MTNTDDIFEALDNPTPVAPTQQANNGGNQGGYGNKSKTPNIYETKFFKPQKINKDILNAPNKEVVLILNDSGLETEEVENIAKIVKAIISIGYKVRMVLSSKASHNNDVAMLIGDKDNIINFVPWKSAGKNITVQRSEDVVPDITTYYHRSATFSMKKDGVTTGFNDVSAGRRAFLAMPTQVMLGKDAKTPASMVITMTADGSESTDTARWKTTGGVSNFIFAAADFNIPVFNLSKSTARLMEFIKTLKEKNEKSTEPTIG